MAAYAALELSPFGQPRLHRGSRVGFKQRVFDRVHIFAQHGVERLAPLLRNDRVWVQPEAHTPL